MKRLGVFPDMRFSTLKRVFERHENGLHKK